MNSAVLVAAISAAGVYLVYRALREQDQDQQVEPLVSEGDRVVVVGDSLAVGLRSHLTKLAHADGVQLDYAAEVGSQTREWTDRLPSLQGAAAIVVVLGTNDAAGSGKAFKAAMESILEQARSQAAAVVWAHPTGTHLPSFEYVSRAIMQAYAEGRIHAVVEEPSEGYAPDRVHLTPTGYARWADEIWQTVR